ncbi:hypothetical protein JXA48_01535 [Candidatus Woesearchaeota archaeon]|nr:hypothetical protein [Candidatus Woesearchaeota archaeon]
MFFDKKGTELSMNVIIIAAIAILVLVILAMFVFRSSDRVDKGTGCTSLSGSCLPMCGGDYPLHNAGFDGSCGTGSICCMPIGVKSN